MGDARTWKLVGTGAVAVAMGLTGLTAFGAISAASTSHDHRPPFPPGRGPADQGPPGLPGGTTLTIGATGGSGSGTSSSGTILEVSSYDFVAPEASGTTATGTGLAPDTLVVTTSLAGQSELTALSQAGSSGELVVHGGAGPGGLDATFTGLSLRQYEVSSAGGGTMTYTFAFTGVTLGSPTTTGSSSSSSSGS